MISDWLVCMISDWLVCMSFSDLPDTSQIPWNNLNKESRVSSLVCTQQHSRALSEITLVRKNLSGAMGTHFTHSIFCSKLNIVSVLFRINSLRSKSLQDPVVAKLKLEGAK